MKIPFSMINAKFLLGVLLAYQAGLTGAHAQARPGAGTRQSPSRDNVTIRKIDGVGAACMVRTPEYKTTVTVAQSGTPKWARISVDYETKDKWTDELEFRYYVLVQQPETKAYLLFTGTVTYIDIAKGRHLSDVFLRPNTVERYGSVERAGVEIYSNGERVAAASVPTETQAWWQTISGKVKTVEGVLLNRSQTPFAFVGCDNYETIKPK